MKFHWLFQWKLTDLTVKNICFTDETVKRQITDSISENLTDSDLESSLRISCLYEWIISPRGKFFLDSGDSLRLSVMWLALSNPFSSSFF